MTRTERIEGSRGIGLGPGRRFSARAGRNAAGHQLDELVEEIVAIVRPGARFRMVLDGKRREVPVAEALHGAVGQIQMGELKLGMLEKPGLDREAVVLP